MPSKAEREAAEAATVERLRSDPVFFVREVLGAEPWEKQREILEGVRDYPEVAVASCHAAGKSWISAREVLCFLYPRRLSRVVTTAPTFDQVRDIIWVEIRRAFESSKTKLGGRMYETPRLDLGTNWFATGRATDDPNKFQGKHAETGSILVIADEASGIEDDIWVGIDGILTSDDSHLLAIGNPTDPGSEFHRMFQRPGVKKIHISAFDTPNFTTFGITLDDIRNGTWKEKITGPLPAPYLITPEWVAKRLEKWGEDSPLWISRVLGEFPDVSTDTLIRLSWIEAAQRRVLEPSAPDVLGVDVARQGSDETVITHRRGPVFRTLKVTRQEDTMQTTGRVVVALNETKASEARIDAVGIGAGVFDRLIELKKPAVEMQSGQAAKDPERFANARAEWWWGLRERFESGDIDIDPADDELAAQLSQIKYKFTSRGQILIESKEDMKKRGLASPDRGDGHMLAAADIRQAPTLVFSAPSGPVVGSGGFAPHRRVVM